MSNPWQEVSLSDYENHMKLDTVMQLQVLNDMMKIQLNSYDAETAMILGIAGGNGLEHIDKGKYHTVYGVDVNESYLRETAERYRCLDSILKCLCVDLMTDISVLPESDILIADLLIEYIGYECFQNVVRKVKPKYVSCGIQINEGKEFVSESPYLHSFDGLESVHHQIETAGLTECMNRIGYRRISVNEYPLPNGKKLVKADFCQ